MPRSFNYAKFSESTANGVLRCQDTLLFHLEWSVWVPRVAGRDPLAYFKQCILVTANVGAYGLASRSLSAESAKALPRVSL